MKNGLGQTWKVRPHTKETFFSEILEYLAQNINFFVERYDLHIGAAGVFLYSDSVWGLLRGFESFYQSIYAELDGDMPILKIQEADVNGKKIIILSKYTNIFLLITFFILKFFNTKKIQKSQIFHTKLC